MLPLASLVITKGISQNSVTSHTNMAAPSRQKDGMGGRKKYTSAQAIELIQEWAGQDFAEEGESDLDINVSQGSKQHYCTELRPCLGRSSHTQ